MKTTKIISVILSVLMLLSVFPVSAFAEEECVHAKGYFSEARVEPTCVDAGNIAYKVCKQFCGYMTDMDENPITFEETIIPATGVHSFDENNVCTVCGTIYVHEHQNGVATCISKAVCGECGEAYGETDKDNHESDETVIKNAVEASCKKEGYTGDTYYKCCDTLKTKGEIIELKKHNESTRIENEIAPTCSENGSFDKVIFCLNCGLIVNKENVTVPSTGEHNYFMEVESSRVEPTCSSKGSVIMKCLCSAETLIEIGINPEAHSWDEWITVDEANCTENGLMKRVCKYNSAHVETKIIYADGHATEKIDAVEATCTEEGNIDYWQCGKCSKMYEDAECTVEVLNVTVSMKDHSFTRYVSDNNATCIKDGTMTAVCDNCKTAADIKTEEGSMNFAPHIPDENGSVCLLCSKVLSAAHSWSETVVEIKKASCTEDGAMAIVCTDCGEIKEGTKTVITASGHNYTEDWNEILPSNCQQNGVKIKICKNCYGVISELILKTEHLDSDGNGICEACGYNSNPVAPSPEVNPDNPVTPEPELKPEIPAMPEISEPSQDCSCDCHKDGIEGFFFDFLNFFYKIFGINRVCACGKAH